jgi:hypothetical protein
LIDLPLSKMCNPAFFITKSAFTVIVPLLVNVLVIHCK